MARNLELQEEEPNLPQPGIRNSPLCANRASTTQAQVCHAWYTEQGMAPRETGLYLIDGHHRFLPLGHTHEAADKIHEIPAGYMRQYFLSA